MTWDYTPEPENDVQTNPVTSNTVIYENPCDMAIKPESALDIQVSGTHYKALKIQPVEYIHANGIGFCEGNAIKYLSRWRDKGGLSDLEKARHFIDLLIELESKK